MKRTDGFMLKEIHGIPYLLPYGQRAAEQRRAMRLNESGVFLWNTLPEAKDKDELLRLFARRYEALPAELPELAQDMNAFLDELRAWGMLDEENVPETSIRHALCIGGVHVALLMPPELSLPQFADYTEETKKDPDLTICIRSGSGLPSSPAQGCALICTEELFVLELETEYLIRFPLTAQITECRLTKDGTMARMYITPPFREPLLSDLFHAIRLIFLYRAQHFGWIAVHSASLHYRDLAWLFAGSSGTGKSTHTNLWNRQFGTPLINGDLNLISVSDGQPVVAGTPWCGTSGISLAGTWPLGGVIHLKQHAENVCQKLTGEEQVLGLVHRTISPSWTREQLERNLALADRIAGQIFHTRLLCTATPEAAIYMRQQIDAFLSAGISAGEDGNDIE